MIDPLLLDILQCPRCAGALAQEGPVLRCAACHTVSNVVEGIPIFVDGPSGDDPEIAINKLKWGEFWDAFDWDDHRRAYETDNLPYIWRHLETPPSGWFLELGGGPSYLAFDAASIGAHAVSVDLDLNILLTAQRHFRRHDRAGHFVCANIMHLPFRDHTFAASAGIGVLEHSRHIERAVTEIARISRSGGVTFQTLPHLSFLTLLTSTMRYGTVPHLSILRSLVTTVHVRMLRMRRMRYGYEESFSHRFLEQAFRANGFRCVEVGFYDYNRNLFRDRRLLAWVSRKLLALTILGHRPFDDLVYVKATR